MYRLCLISESTGGNRNIYLANTMSLSPWDLGGQMTFNFDLYQPRRGSYVFATRMNRRRNESYRYANKSSIRHAFERKEDFIEGELFYKFETNIHV